MSNLKQVEKKLDELSQVLSEARKRVGGWRPNKEQRAYLDAKAAYDRQVELERQVRRENECGIEHKNGYRCTLLKKHRGRHAVHGYGSTRVVDRWTDAESKVPAGSSENVRH